MTFLPYRTAAPPIPDELPPSRVQDAGRAGRSVLIVLIALHVQGLIEDGLPVPVSTSFAEHVAVG